MAKLLGKLPEEIEEMDASWFARGLAFEEFEAEERIRASREAAGRSRSRGRSIRTMSGETVSAE